MALLNISCNSHSLMRNVQLTMLMPERELMAEEGPKPPYKLLILLHGMMGGAQDWLCNTRLPYYARQSNLAILMPNAENKFYTDNPRPGEAYSRFIGKELPALARAMFQISDKREDTYIAGLSMGGFGAMLNGLKYHNNFGCIASLSGAFITDNIPPADDSEQVFFRTRS